jgi:hypothetical protein
MTTIEETTAMFRAFVESEDRAVANGIESDWYPGNWHRLRPELRRAPPLLSPDMLERLYVHLLRHDVLPNRAELQDTYPVLERAYGIQTRYMVHRAGPPMSLMTRFEGLLLFGFDHRTIIAANVDIDDYLRCRAAWLQFDCYEHIPGIAEGARGLLPYAQDPQLIGRICQVMGVLKFIHDDRYDPASPYRDEHYAYTRLPFWAAMFTLLLSPLRQARDTTNAFQSAPQLPRRREQMEILERLKSAAASVRPAGDRFGERWQ